MKKFDLALGPEWAALECLCLGLTTPQEREAFEALLQSPDLHWGELLEQALRHKMLPLLAFHVLSDSLEASVPRRVKDHLRATLDLNRHKRTLWYREAARIVQALNEQEIRVAGRKDVAFETALYGGNGSRRLGDIDLLVVPQDKEQVVTIMTGLGYQTGLYNWQTDRIAPLSRKEMLLFQLNPDHIPTLSLLTDDPVVRYIEVDFAISLTWTRSPFDVPVEAALAEIVYQPVSGFSGVEMPCLSSSFQFISTVLHLFREAWFERWLDWEQDVDLAKFGDVVRLWRAYREILGSQAFVQTVEDFGIVEPVLWVLEHLDRTLHTDIVPTLGWAGRATEDWLSSARASGGAMRHWQGSMRQRLHCKDRRRLFVDADESDQ